MSDNVINYCGLVACIFGALLLVILTQRVRYSIGRTHRNFGIPTPRDPFDPEHRSERVVTGHEIGGNPKPYRDGGIVIPRHPAVRDHVDSPRPYHLSTNGEVLDFKKFASSVPATEKPQNFGRRRRSESN